MGGLTLHIPQVIPRQAFESAEKGAASNPQDEAIALHDKALELYEVADATYSPTELEESTDLMRKAISLATTTHAERALYSLNLATIMHALFRLNASPQVLEDAITLAQEALEQIPEGMKARFMGQCNLIIMAYHKYELSGEVDDLDNVINMGNTLIPSLAFNDPGRAFLLGAVGSMLGVRFKHSDDEQDLREALSLTQQSLQLASNVGVADLWSYEHSLAMAWHAVGENLVVRYRRTQDASYLDEAVIALKEAIKRASNGLVQQSWMSLGSALDLKYELTASLPELEKAIDAVIKAVNMGVDKDTFFNCCLVLTARYGKHFERTGLPDDLNEAIRVGMMALEASDDHPSRPQLLHVVGLRFFDQYESSGSLACFEKAMGYIKQSLEHLDKTDSDWPIFATSLASGHHTHFRRTGALAELDMAIDIATDVVETPGGNPSDHLVYSHNLAIYIGEKYHRTERRADLERHIEIMTGVVENSQGHRRHAAYTEALAASLSVRFDRFGDMADIDRSIALFRQILTDTSTDSIYQVSIRRATAMALRARYLQFRSIGDINEAITLLKEAVDLLAQDHPQRADVLYSLGVCLSNRSQNIDNGEEDATEAMSNLKLSLEQAQSPPRARIQAGRLLMAMDAERSLWQDAYQASGLALDLIHALTPRYSNDHTDKQHALGEWAGLASECAALGLQAGEPPISVLTMLEKGRGLFASSMEDQATDLSTLQSTHPKLAHRFLKLRTEMRVSSSPEALTETGSESLVGGTSERRRQADQEFEELATEIRRCPGFERFLLPPSESDILQAAEDGPLVVVNSTALRADAIIVSRHQVTAIPLPRLDRRQLFGYLNLGALNTLECLEWLWDCIASPVLEALGFESPPTADDDWPHVWWVMTGLLGRIPIHAAGYHMDQSFNTVLDRVISSYHPSISSIIRSRRNPSRQTPIVSGQALLVGMASTAGSTSLKCVPQEISAIQDLCRMLSLQAVQPTPSKGQILAQLPGCSVFHFAGHGFSDYDNPLESYLALDRDKQNSITIKDLLKINLFPAPPLLAYLSACATGQVQNDSFVDESLHIISGCLLAGFRHVIGTLWKVEDVVCQQMAKLTYEGLREHGLCEGSVSWALHKATRTLRDQWVSSLVMGVSHRLRLAATQDSDVGDGGIEERGRGGRTIVSADFDDVPLSWVPYVHYGL